MSKTRVLRGALALMAVGVIALAGALWRDLGVQADLSPPPSGRDASQEQRGAYLARIGNCQGCHNLEVYS